MNQADNTQDNKTTPGERIAGAIISIACGGIWLVLVPVAWAAIPAAVATTILGLAATSGDE